VGRRQVVEIKRLAVEQPWKCSNPQEKQAALCAMYDRCIWDWSQFSN
jgi:hypothetical protein